MDRIPSRFIDRHIRLRGCVRRVDQDATLYVEHIPVIRLSWKGVNSRGRLPITHRQCPTIDRTVFDGKRILLQWSVPVDVSFGN